MSASEGIPLPMAHDDWSFEDKLRARCIAAEYLGAMDSLRKMYPHLVDVEQIVELEITLGLPTTGRVAA